MWETLRRGGGGAARSGAPPSSSRPHLGEYLPGTGLLGLLRSGAPAAGQRVLRSAGPFRGWGSGARRLGAAAKVLGCKLAIQTAGEYIARQLVAPSPPSPSAQTACGLGRLGSYLFATLKARSARASRTFGASISLSELSRTSVKFAQCGPMGLEGDAVGPAHKAFQTLRGISGRYPAGRC